VLNDYVKERYMWYGDPKDARRNARRTARAARRNARRAYRYGYGYGRPGGGIGGMIFIVFIILGIFTHFWGFFMLAIFLPGIIFWLLRSGILNSLFQGSQPQEPYYQPPPQEQPYTSYEQGYQPPPQAEGQPQTQDPEYRQYEEPQAQYPDQLPPMQQR
jgi:hypothetical protein